MAEGRSRGTLIRNSAEANAPGELNQGTGVCVLFGAAIAQPTVVCRERTRAMAGGGVCVCVRQPLPNPMTSRRRFSHPMEPFLNDSPTLASTLGSSATMETPRAAAPFHQPCYLASAEAWVWPGFQQSSAIQDTGTVWHWLSRQAP